MSFRQSPSDYPHMKHAVGYIEPSLSTADGRRNVIIGFLRYEALRTLSTRAFAQLHDRNMKGERFDDLVDDLVNQQAQQRFGLIVHDDSD